MNTQCAGKTVISLENACHTWAPQRCVHNEALYKSTFTYLYFNESMYHHVNTICDKAASRLYFLKLLKWAAVSTNDLLSFYVAVIKPVLEYGCSVWHTSLTLAQSKPLSMSRRKQCESYTTTWNTHRRWQCLISSISTSREKNLHDIFCCWKLTVYIICCRQSETLTVCLNSSEQIPTHWWLREQLNSEIQ